MHFEAFPNMSTYDCNRRNRKRFKSYRDHFYMLLFDEESHGALHSCSISRRHTVLKQTHGSKLPTSPARTLYRSLVDTPRPLRVALRDSSRTAWSRSTWPGSLGDGVHLDDTTTREGELDLSA